MHKCNIDFFKNIDIEEKAYWLGFLYADGCVTQNHKALHINLSPVDINHLNKFNQSILSDYEIKYKDHHGKQTIYSILSYLYDEGSIYLDRKYDKYLCNIPNFIDKRKVKNNIPVTITA